MTREREYAPQSFRVLIERILGHEGGYVNDPNDPGRETKWGISKRSYPDLSIAGLSREEAIDIYYRDFWKPLAAKFPMSLGFQVLDAAVNHGMGNAIRILQRAIGVAPDGDWGPRSKEALASMSPSMAILAFLGERLNFYTQLSTWNHFGKGWANRISGNAAYAVQDLRASNEE